MDDAALRADFEAFARDHWSTLMSIAVAVSPSRGEAEDLVQTALMSAFVRWRRIRRDEALAYLRRSIVNANVSRWRKHRNAVSVHAEPPEVAPRGARNAADDIEDRHDLLVLLRRIPDRQRAVLVLRYLCDLRDDEIAATLRVSPSTVRSQAFRGLASLRSLASSSAHDFEEVPS